MCNHDVQGNDVLNQQEVSVTHNDVGDCREATASNLIEYYKYFLRECKSSLKQYLFGVDEDENDTDIIGVNLRNPFPKLNYPLNDPQNMENHDYRQQETDDLYFCKYGLAYALEYTILYEILFALHNKKYFGVYSFGCGSFIDAWSLAYARAKRPSRKYIQLQHQGIDRIKWATTVFNLADQTEPLSKLIFSLDNTQRTVLKYTVHTLQGIPEENMHSQTKQEIPEGIMRSQTKQKIPEGIMRFHPLRKNAAGETKETDDMMYNVLMFPKILNELTDEAVDEFVKHLGQFHFMDNRTYYICVSHSPAQLKRGLKAVEKIIAQFTENEGFVCLDDLEASFPDEDGRNINALSNRLNRYFIHKRDENEAQLSRYLFYRISPNPDDIPNTTDSGSILSSNGNRRVRFSKNEMGKYVLASIPDLDSTFREDQIKAFLKNLDDAKPARKCQQMTWNEIIFQIIRLRKLH